MSANREINDINEVRFRKFFPIDRDSPIYEVMFENDVIIDVARSVGTDLNSDFAVGFHASVTEVLIRGNVLTQIIDHATALVERDEAEL